MPVQDNEKLIEEAAATIAVAELVRTHRTWGDLIEPQKDEYRRVARAALAVFEKAHTPTDDEREALAAYLCDIAGGNRRTEVEKEVWRERADEAFRIGGFRRSEVSEPQGEPSDAEVDAAARALNPEAWRAYDTPFVENPALLVAHSRAQARAALRAAGGLK